MKGQQQLLIARHARLHFLSGLATLGIALVVSLIATGIATSVTDAHEAILSFALVAGGIVVAVRSVQLCRRMIAIAANDKRTDALRAELLQLPVAEQRLWLLKHVDESIKRGLGTQSKVEDSLAKAQRVLRERSKIGQEYPLATLFHIWPFLKPYPLLLLSIWQLKRLGRANQRSVQELREVRKIIVEDKDFASEQELWRMVQQRIEDDAMRISWRLSNIQRSQFRP